MNNKQAMWRSNVPGAPIRRHMLKDILPLAVPLSLDIEASSYCCLKCRYCPQSLSEERKKQIKLSTGGGQMDMALFRNIVEQCKEFSHPLKNIRFAGFGEPLLNPNIDNMVRLAKEEGIADTVTIFTNGIALTEDLSRSLVDAGVDTLLIDIQGICDADYERVANTKISFERLYRNVQCLANMPGRGRIFIKIFKFAIAGREKEFFDLFAPYCDEIGIENIYEIYPEIDYTGMITEEKETCNLDFFKSTYCSYPWFQMAIDASGNVTACTLPVSKSSPFLGLGNVMQESLIQIWSGRKMNTVRARLLDDRSSCADCKDCKYTELLPREDVIDEIVPKLQIFCKQNERRFPNA